ncbi:MAG: efflux transporter periplasmic adaptor subunit, partial [Pseudomonadota bacterium]
MSETRDRDRPGRWRGLLWVLLSAAVLVGVLVLLWGIEETADVTLREIEPPAPLVSLVAAAASEARAEVSVFGELRPRWNAEIRAAVSGRIIEVHDAALAGTRVEGGTPLFSIEPTPYETAVAEAEMHLEDARLSYLQAQ